MSHEINILDNGVASFASAREHAWHRLGVVVENSMTAQEALEAAYLANWNVRKTRIVAIDDMVGPKGSSGTIEIENRWATIYTDPISGRSKYLGVVGGTYTPIQNETHVDLLNAIVDESGAHFETAGSLRGGRETFITMKLPKTLNFNGDVVDLYLVAINSHDGTSSFRFLITPIRVVCANTLAAAIADARASFSTRHVRGATGYIQEAREALGLTFNYIDRFESEVEKMIGKNISEKTFTKIASRLFNLDIATTTRQKNKASEHVAGVVNLFNTSETLTDIKGTRWAGYNAFTEYVDHYMSVRTVNGREATDVRASRAVLGAPALELKAAAFTAFSRAVLA